MKLVIANGTLYDPKNGIEGEVRDLHIEEGTIVSEVSNPDRVIDASGLVVMAGAIDIHSHVATYGLNWARYHFEFPTPREIGNAYTRIGYTHVHESFMTPITAGYVHHELSSIPVVDTSASLVVNLVDLDTRLKSSDDRKAVEEALSLLMFHTRGLTIKLYEPFVRYENDIYAFRNTPDGEVLAFFSAPGERILSRIFLHTYPSLLDQEILAPERFHFCHLGSALDSDRRYVRAERFLAMGATGDMGLFGRAGRLKVALCDPKGCEGHIRLMLGFSRPLCIGKADRFNAQMANRAFRLALRHPRSLAFSTDMPNHGGLESYPPLFGDLMNQRACHPDGETEVSARQYTLQDFVRVTRQIPAEILNLSDKGHLGIGGVADIALYDLKDESIDLSARLGSCAFLVKRGKVVVEEFMMAREEVDKRTYYSGTEGEGDALAREICRSTSLRFENLRVGEEMTGKTVYVTP